MPSKMASPGRSRVVFHMRLTARQKKKQKKKTTTTRQKSNFTLNKIIFILLRETM